MKSGTAAQPTSGVLTVDAHPLTGGVHREGSLFWVLFQLPLLIISLDRLFDLIFFDEVTSYCFRQDT